MGPPLPGSRPSETSARFSQVDALDGLRGIAVLAVLLFHAGLSWLPGGFLGVDVFFVLSGYLITSLLLDELDSEKGLRLGAFWARRARRLFPALLVLVAGVCLYAWVLVPPEERHLVRADILWTLGYGANWHFIFEGNNYFAANAAPSPLGHTWSLAIEEQFYVLWPLILLALSRRRPGLTPVAAVAGAAAVVSATAMAVIYHPGGDPSRAYYGTDSRAHVILIGAFAAVLMTGWRRRRRGRLGTTRAAHGLALLALPAGCLVLGSMLVAHGDSGWVYRGGLAAIAVGVAVVIAASEALPSGPLGRLLGWEPLRRVGFISYGLYLYHLPIYLVLDHSRTGLGGTALLLLRLLATFAAAAISYRWIELPVRRSRLVTGRRLLAIAPISFVAAGSVAVAATAAPATSLAAPAPVPPGSALARSLDSPTSTVAPAPSGPRSTRPPRAPGQPLKVMFIGDSVAETLAVGMEAPARSAGVDIDNEGDLGCGIVTDSPYRYFGATHQELPQCLGWPQRWSALVASHQPDVVLLVAGRWEVMDRVHNGAWTRLGDPGYDAYVQQQLEQAVQVLSSGGAVVAVATAPYYLRGETPSGGRYPEDDPARVDDFNRLVREVVAHHPQTTTLVDLGGHTSVGGRYTPYVDGIEMRYDGVHFTVAADHWMEPWLMAQLESVGPPVRQ